MTEKNIRYFYPLFGLSTEELMRTVQALEGYWKAISIAYLDFLGLPTLKGLAVLEWKDSTKLHLTQFLDQMDWLSVVIRTDRKGGMGANPPLGGYLVVSGDLEEEVRGLIVQGRIVMLLEPRNRYRNLYGVNVMYDKRMSGSLYLEVVGPGFDVSDINRGDITPHERIWIERSVNGRILKRHIMSAQDYEESVVRRLAKIGRMALARGATDATTEADLSRIGRGFLERSGYTLLTDSRTYQPISVEQLNRILHFTHDLPEKMAEVRLDTDLFVLSSTIFQEKEELVFWDIAWPAAKYDRAIRL